MKMMLKSEGEGLMIPTSIFVPDLSPMESIVKYLRENRGLRFSDMQGLLKRDQRVLAITYKRTTKKFPQVFAAEGYFIPVMIFQEDLSVFESVVFFLHGNSRLSFGVIGQMMGKNYHTVRTSYLRAMKKFLAK